MTTRRAASKSIATSSAPADLTRPAYTSSAENSPATFGPIAPVSTFPNDRFIALHMIRVRIRPDAPTKDPVMIKTLFSRTNPVEAAARPE